MRVKRKLLLIYIAFWAAAFCGCSGKGEFPARYGDKATEAAEGGEAYGDGSFEAATEEDLSETEEAAPEPVVEDMSDSDAPDISSGTIRGFRIEFRHEARDSHDGFQSGEYVFLGGDTEDEEIGSHSCCLLCDGEQITSFDIDEEDLELIDGWLSERGLKSENGWNKKSTGDEACHLMIEVEYEEGTLHILSEGRAAAPSGWEEEGFLELVENIAGKHC